MYQIYLWLKNKIFPSTIPHQYSYGDNVYYHGDKWIVTRTSQWGESYVQSMELSSSNGRIKTTTSNVDVDLKPIQRVYF